MSCSEKQLRIQLETLNEQLERLRRENDTLKLDKCELSERLAAEQRQGQQVRARLLEAEGRLNESARRMAEFSELKSSNQALREEVDEWDRAWDRLGQPDSALSLAFRDKEDLLTHSHVEKVELKKRIRELEELGVKAGSENGSLRERLEEQINANKQLKDILQQKHISEAYKLQAHQDK